jgi:hypothetical protein
VHKGNSCIALIKFEPPYKFSLNLSCVAFYLHGNVGFTDVFCAGGIKGTNNINYLIVYPRKTLLWDNTTLTLKMGKSFKKSPSYFNLVSNCSI